MNRKNDLLLLLLLCSTSLFGQSKQEAIAWFSNNFISVLAYPGEVYSNVRLERVDECEIVISYRINNETTQLTFATKLISIDDSYGFLQSNDDYSGILIRKNGQLDPGYVRSFAIKKSSISVVQQKLQQIAGFCHNDEDTWKTKEDALSWLEGKLKKYAYTNNKYNDYYVMNPKLDQITDCFFTFSFTLFEGSGGDWGSFNKVGKVTETIAMNMDRLSTMDHCFQNDSPKVRKSDNLNGKSVTSNLSIIQIAAAEENLHERILKAMHFLYQKCGTASVDLRSAMPANDIARTSAYSN